MRYQGLRRGRRWACWRAPCAAAGLLRAALVQTAATGADESRRCASVRAVAASSRCRARARRRRETACITQDRRSSMTASSRGRAVSAARLTLRPSCRYRAASVGGTRHIGKWARRCRGRRSTRQRCRGKACEALKSGLTTFDNSMSLPDFSWVDSSTAKTLESWQSHCHVKYLK